MDLNVVSRRDRRRDSNAKLYPGDAVAATQAIFMRRGIPFGQCGRAAGFEIVSADKVAILVDMIVEGGVNSAEHLQGLHLSEPLHGSFPSSARQVGVLDAVVQPAACDLLLGRLQVPEGGAVGFQAIGEDGLGGPVPPHNFLQAVLGVVNGGAA
jgi:hypothetical protein